MNAIVEQAKALPEQGRAALLDALFGLVSPGDPVFEQAWVEECERRAVAVERGEMSLVSAD